MKKYLIFTVTAGNGHNATAKAIEEKIKSAEPEATIKVIDIFKAYETKLKYWIIGDGYALTCKYALGPYNSVFKNLLNKRPLRVDKNTAQSVTRKMTPKVLKEIFSFKPDVIFCTHFYAGVIMTNIRKSYEIPAKVFSIILDYGISPFWESTTGVDYIITPNNDFDEDLIYRGFKPEQLLPFGIPIKEKFSEKTDKILMRKQLGLKEDLFTVIIMRGGGEFGMKTKAVMKRLLKVKPTLQIVVINGKDKKGKKCVDKLIIKNKSLKHKIVNLGFVNNVESYFSAGDLLVGKCGGLTATESLAKSIPMLIFKRLPQQEIHNRDYLVKNGCAIAIRKNKDITTKTEALALDDKILQSLNSAITNIKKTDATNKLYEFIKNFDNVTYENYNFYDVKNSELIKKIFKNSKKTLIF